MKVKVLKKGDFSKGYNALDRIRSVTKAFFLQIMLPHDACIVWHPLPDTMEEKVDNQDHHSGLLG